MRMVASWEATDYQHGKLFNLCMSPKKGAKACWKCAANWEEAQDLDYRCCWPVAPDDLTKRLIQNLGPVPSSFPRHLIGPSGHWAAVKQEIKKEPAL